MYKVAESTTRQNKPADDAIAPDLIEIIRERLAEGKRVRRTLPFDGRLHIDRTLPFLMVYRRPTRYSDHGTNKLVKGEASYLIASGNRKLQPSLTTLVKTIVETLSGKCEGFLILEIWTNTDKLSDDTYDPGRNKTSFRIITSPQHPPTRTIETFEVALKRIRINRKSATVEIVYDKIRAPQKFKTLLTSAEARKLNCFIIGLEIAPIYHNPETGEVFPLVLRKLHQGLAQAIKKAVFEFSHNQTNLRPISYQALGRRAAVKAVWEVDEKLADISSQFDFLLLSTPVNIESALKTFQKDRFEKLPIFYYRPRPIDPSILKYKLFDIRIEHVEDPTLAAMFHDKRREIDRQLTMLADRGTKEFLYGSLQLYGTVGDDLLQLAENMLHAMPPRGRGQTSNGYLNAKAFAEHARREIDYYRKLYPEISATVQIRNDTVGLMVSRGNLLISQKVNIPTARCEALLQHEVGTHVLTYFNGRAQPLRLLYCGLTGYEELQEGLAVLAEYLVGGLNKARLRILAGRIIAAHHMIKDASFIDTYRILNRDYGFPQRTSFIITTRTYRAGGLTKDIVYLRGLIKLLKYLKNNGELDPLFVGKVAIDHVAIIKELQLRNVLHPMPLYPRYLNDEQTKLKLNQLQKGISVLELIGGMK